MQKRFTPPAWGLALIIALAALGGDSLAGQSAPAAVGPEGPTSLRTPWGTPDLRGTWTNATTTPLERPADLANKEFLTDEEAAQRDRQVAEARSTDREPAAGNPGTYNEFWWERGGTVAGNRTSLIIDPPDGRLPALTAEARANAETADARTLAAIRAGEVPPDGPEQMDLNDRCILGPTAGPPLVSAAYNNNFHIFQTPQHVAIFAEYMHQVRIIPLDGRPFLSPQVRQWMGDSRGRWEGDTLVVETRNYSGKTDGNLPVFGGATEHRRLVERFRRVDADTIDYQFTIEDPTKYVRSWTAAIPLTKFGNPLFEYACHEGNYGLLNILAGSVKHRAAHDGTGRESRVEGNR